MQYGAEAALGAFHTIGVDFEGLPDEESCDQNHIALEQLLSDIAEATDRAEGTEYQALYQEYTRGAG